MTPEQFATKTSATAASAAAILATPPTTAAVKWDAAPLGNDASAKEGG